MYYIDNDYRYFDYRVPALVITDEVSLYQIHNIIRTKYFYPLIVNNNTLII